MSTNKTEYEGIWKYDTDEISFDDRLKKIDKGQKIKLITRSERQAYIIKSDVTGKIISKTKLEGNDKLVAFGLHDV